MTTSNFLYFAYGSNMSSRRLKARVASAELISQASVTCHRLVFDKRSRDGSGKADCQRTANPTDQVLGGLFRISSIERMALDLVEGAGNGYEAVEIVVCSGGASHEAITYLATDKQEGLAPYTWYLRHVLEGCAELGLPPEYIANIQTVVWRNDLDLDREARELSIYV